MPTKITFVCVIHLITEKDSKDYIIRESIAIIRKEDNVNMDVKVVTFTPKNTSVPRWVPIFETGSVLRFTRKFALDEQPPHNTLEVIKFY